MRRGLTLIAVLVLSCVICCSCEAMLDGFKNSNTQNQQTEKKDITMPNLVGMMLPEAKKSLKDLGVKDITVNTNNNEFVIDSSNWIVFKQGTDEGSIISNGNKVVLTVGRVSDYIIEYFSGKTIAEAFELADSLGFDLNYVDEASGETIWFQRNDSNFDKWSITKLEATSKSKKVATVWIRFTGTAVVPSVKGLTVDEARQKLKIAHITNVSVVDENNFSVKDESICKVKEQSIAANESIDVSKTITLVVDYKSVKKSFVDISFEVPANWDYTKEEFTATVVCEEDYTLLRLGCDRNYIKDMSKSTIEQYLLKQASGKDGEDKYKVISTTKTNIGQKAIEGYLCIIEGVSGQKYSKSCAYVFKLNGDLYIAYYVCLENEKYDYFLEKAKIISESISVNTEYINVENNSDLAELVSLDRSKSKEKIAKLVDKLKGKVIRVNLVVKDYNLIKGTRFEYVFVPEKNGKINKNGPLFYFPNIGYIDFKFTSQNGPGELVKNVCIDVYIKLSEYKDEMIYVSLDHEHHSGYVGKFN